jgi:hypothetical protein
MARGLRCPRGVTHVTLSQTQYGADVPFPPETSPSIPSVPPGPQILAALENSVSSTNWTDPQGRFAQVRVWMSCVGEWNGVR